MTIRQKPIISGSPPVGKPSQGTHSVIDLVDSVPEATGTLKTECSTGSTLGDCDESYVQAPSTRKAVVYGLNVPEDPGPALANMYAA
jgi:hypothetical protein